MSSLLNPSYDVEVEEQFENTLDICSGEPISKDSQILKPSGNLSKYYKVKCISNLTKITKDTNELIDLNKHGGDIFSLEYIVLPENYNWNVTDTIEIHVNKSHMWSIPLHLAAIIGKLEDNHVLNLDKNLFFFDKTILDQGFPNILNISFKLKCSTDFSFDLVLDNLYFPDNVEFTHRSFFENVKNLFRNQVYVNDHFDVRKFDICFFKNEAEIVCDSNYMSNGFFIMTDKKIDDFMLLIDDVILLNYDENMIRKYCIDMTHEHILNDKHIIWVPFHKSMPWHSNTHHCSLDLQNYSNIVVNFKKSLSGVIYFLTYAPAKINHSIMSLIV